MKFEFVRNRWSLDMFPRIALGSTHSTADLSGSTQYTAPSGAVTYPAPGSGQTPPQPTQNGGLLVQYGPGLNGGSHEQDNFTVVPQLDLNLGFQVTNHTKVVVGYTGLYWNNVARAGEQIDRSVNPNNLPGSGTTGGTANPAFTFHDTGFWAQGVNVGLDCRW